MSVQSEPILPRVPSTWRTSEAQRDRLDQLDAEHPGTHFQVVLWWPLSCALVVEWYDGAGEGDFTLAPNGRMMPIHGELPAGAVPA